ncbi:MAG TPA: hypothetical protein VEA44_06255 [Caulobacter sp.]|nr:hypothetical protein [Caulobacter sp.]
MKRTTTGDEGRTSAAPVFLVSWTALESALSLLASPDKADNIPTVVSALRKTQGSAAPDKLLLQILSATAWLTSDESCPPAGEASMT